MAFWKINCMEGDYPGLWQSWFREQCVAVGWAAAWGYKLTGKSEGGHGWSRTRNALRKIARGDYLVVQLRDHRIGRIGMVTDVRVGDDQWNPLVSPQVHPDDGEMGRRIDVRWDLSAIVPDPGIVVALPESARLNNGLLRPTIAALTGQQFTAIRHATHDEANWVSLLSSFHYEKALSDFIATFPQRIEDGLEVHPTKRIREHRFPDGTRADVMLVDRAGCPVVVECKRGNPSPKDVKQLAGYLKHIKRSSKSKPRGVLVHGGARKLHSDVKKALKGSGNIEVIRYRLDVDFDRCD